MNAITAVDGGNVIFGIHALVKDNSHLRLAVTNRVHGREKLIHDAKEQLGVMTIAFVFTIK